MLKTSNPFETTIKGLKNTANVLATVRRIQSKLIDHGIISDAEEQVLRQYTDYGQISKKEVFTQE